MKIKTKEISYAEVIKLSQSKKKIKPKKPNMLFRTLLKIVSMPELIATGFRCEKIGMNRLGKKEPCLILMNHSSFIDMKIAASVLYPRPFNIICTTDGFVGKRFLMRQLGCIPTNKFVPDFGLVKQMKHVLTKLKSSVLMYPEAGYSFDGTATVLPDNVGKLIKFLGVPVVMIRTSGAFARDPLYNNLQKRKVKVSAVMEYIISPEDTKERSAEELQEIAESNFRFDGFRWQQESNVEINEKFRADHLDRVLYKCPDCLDEGKMTGLGTKISCSSCGSEHELTKQGFLKKLQGSEIFRHIPDWFNWQRSCVKTEIEQGRYSLDTEVDIYMLVDTKRLYKVGSGRLVHNSDGFTLTGCDGELTYTQKPLASYTLNSDFYWYEIGDVISIGDINVLYYCFPKNSNTPVSKTRLAAEELYKLSHTQLHGEKALT